MTQAHQQLDPALELRQQPDPPLELWGGHECTVNRVGDLWFDQTSMSGHETRLSDLALFARLGIKKLRYPAVWERIAPDDPERPDFRWTDERLQEIRRLEMQPILTLCHHGSGPRYTSLLDDNFAAGLAHHAAAVAERYPWVEDYTPVNEPLTTARFSALYGFWYPHLQDETAFWTALLNETDATRMAMQAIRRVNPAARLVQTDDLGFCHATASLKQEADFQNERRWMSWDLLCGKLVPGHALWKNLVACGLEHRLRVVADAPCPPDVVGVNHYLSSERLLDDRVERHQGRAPADQGLGTCNGVVHVDVDAVRNLPGGAIGLAGLIRQAWQRYGIPVAVTECHLGSTREEQARWFIEVWREAQDLRNGGVNICAVTAWSLLGAYDWNRMVTRFVGHYEPGVFDVRGGTPRPTLMVNTLKELVAGRRPDGPGLDLPGWWRRPPEDAYRVAVTRADGAGARGPLLIVGEDCALSRLAATACESRGLHYLFEKDLQAAIQVVRPWGVLDCGPGSSTALPLVCQSMGINGAFFVPAGPDEVGVPVRGLLAVEHGTVFTADDESLFPVRLLDALDAGIPMSVDGGVAWNGTYGPALIDGVLDLLLDKASGVVCFRPAADGSEADFARALAAVAGLDTDLLEVTGSGTLDTTAAKTFFSLLPPMHTVLERFVVDRRRERTRHEAMGSR